MKAVRFQFICTYMDKESKTLKWRNLTGPEKLKLFKLIKIPELFPNLKNGEGIQQLWNGLSRIYKLLWLPKNMDEKLFKGCKLMDDTIYVNVSNKTCDTIIICTFYQPIYQSS